MPDETKEFRKRLDEDKHEEVSSLQGSRKTDEQPLERFYTVAEIAERWNISKSGAHRLLRNKPGVLLIRSSWITHNGRTRYLIRIPASVLSRIEEEYSVKATPGRYPRRPLSQIRIPDSVWRGRPLERF